MNIRTLLWQQPMLDLIMPQIEASDKYYKDIVQKSNGKFRECRTDLFVTGIFTTHLMTSGLGWMGMDKKDLAMKVLLPAHPEHYVVPPYDIGIVEVIGEYMARLRIIVTEDVPSWVLSFGDHQYPLNMMNKPTIGELDDGTILFYLLPEFHQTERGCDIILRLLFPAAAPQVFFDEYAEHLAIEFRNGLTMVFNEEQERAAKQGAPTE